MTKERKKGSRKRRRDRRREGEESGEEEDEQEKDAAKICWCMHVHFFFGCMYTGKVLSLLRERVVSVVDFLRMSVFFFFLYRS